MDTMINTVGTFGREESAAARWARFAPIVTGEDYVESLRGRRVVVHLFGEVVAEPVDHPIIRPSINALKMTYDLAIEDPELATAYCGVAGRPGDEEPDAAAHGATDGHVFSALRGAGYD
jgi:hypothetical protein